MARLMLRWLGIVALWLVFAVGFVLTVRGIADNVRAGDSRILADRAAFGKAGR